MRAWWSQLLLPQKLHPLAQQVGLLVVVLGRADQKTESGPLALRSSSILALISSSAVSQLMRWYLPSTSFIG